MSGGTAPESDGPKTREVDQELGSSERTIVRRWPEPREGPPEAPVGDDELDEMRLWMEAVPGEVPRDSSERIPFAHPIPGAPPRPVLATRVASNRLRTPDVEMASLMEEVPVQSRPDESPTPVTALRASRASRGASAVRQALPAVPNRGAPIKPVSWPPKASSKRRSSFVPAEEPPAQVVHSSPSPSRSLTHRFFAGAGGIAVLSVLGYLSWPKTKPESAPRFVASPPAASSVDAAPTKTDNASRSTPSAPTAPRSGESEAEPTRTRSREAVKPTDPRAVPAGSDSEAAKAFLRLPVAPDDGPPLGGLGEGGLHVDRLAIGETYERSECHGVRDRFVLGVDPRVNACFRVIHARGQDEVTVLWQKDGETLRRTLVTIGTQHSYRTRAYLTLRDEYVGSWVVRIFSKDGVELASSSFVIEPVGAEPVSTSATTAASVKRRGPAAAKGASKLDEPYPSKALDADPYPTP